MYKYITCAVICAVIWIVNGRCIIRSAREHITGEIYIPSAVLVFGSMIHLKHKGKAKTLAPHGTTTVVQTGIYGIVRHPMWLGMAIWAVALILVFQSVFSIVLSTVAVVCFRMGATKEDEFNIKEFGDDYKEYMHKVPIWNVFKRLK